jgi:hypothetical protein
MEYVLHTIATVIGIQQQLFEENDTNVHVLKMETVRHD